MIHIRQFDYKPEEYERETASNSYLMSLIVIALGLPLPIANLLATLGFYLKNRKSSYFVRWHCTQALMSQLSMFLMNSSVFWWTVSIVFLNEGFSDTYVACMIAVVTFNLTEFIITIYTAIETRKGIHVEWWLFGSLTNHICNKEL